MELAIVALNPGGWLAWIIVGVIAGAVSGRLVAGRGFGCLANLIVGIVGAFLGGFLVGLVVPNGAYGFIGTIVVAVLGATIFLTILRLLGGGRL